MQQSFTIGRLLVYWFLILIGVVIVKPAFGQGYVEDGKRYAMYTLYHYGDSDGSMQKRQILGMEQAFANGCNSVVIGIAWDILQPSLNSAPDWAYIDRFIQVAEKYKAKIAIRLRTGRKDRLGYWPEEQCMRDTRGNIMDLEGTSHARFGYTPAMDKVQEFVRTVAQRYKYINDRGDLLFMSATFNPQWENEYWATNFPDQYKTTYDYNELTIADFQRWALAKYNGSLAELNRAWNTDYSTITAIRPTYPDQNNQGGFPGKRGADWYVFRHQLLKTFNDRFAKTVKSVDPTIHIITEQGSVWDGNSANRGTLAFKSLAELYDGIKVNDDAAYIHQYSMDLLRSNMKPGAWILNEIDGAAYLYERIDKSAQQAEMAEELYRYGAKIITFANFWPDANGEYFKAIMDKIRAKGLLSQPVTTVTPVGTMTFKLSTVVQSNIYETGIFGQWNTIRGGNEGKPVRILIDEDLLATTTTPVVNQAPTVANRVPNQTAVINKAFSFKIPDNTFTDADGQITSVSISGLPVGLNYDAASRTISGTPTLIGLNEITISATDNGNASVTDYFTMTVKRATLPLQLLDPVLDCASGRFEFRSTEGDGTTIEYAADGLYAWNTQTVYTLAEQLRSGKALTIRARQSGTEILLSYTTTCATSTTNLSPVVNSTIPDQVVAVGKALSVSVTANMFSDPDGSIASISVSGLPAGVTYNASTRIISGAVSSSGIWAVTILATDNKGATVTSSFKLTVESSTGVKPFRLLDPLIDCITGRFEFRSADGDGTPVEYAADDLYGYSKQTVYNLVDQFRYGTRLTIRARQSGVDFLIYYTTACPIVNKAPVVSASIGEQHGIVNRFLSITIPAGTFTDPDGQIASVSVSGLPSGLNYDSSTRMITGTVTTTGNWPITVVATDDKGATVSTTFSIVISTDSKPLRLLEPVLNCETGVFEFRSVDGDGTPVEYSIDRLVAWSTQTSFTLAANMRTGSQLDIKARQSGQIVFGVYYTACPPPNQLPTVANPILSQTITQFRNLSVVMPASTFADADGTIATVALMGLPPGLTYTTASLVVSGAPTVTGTWTVTATATDDRGGSVSTMFNVTVVPQQKPLRLLAPLFDCATGKLEFQTADGDGTTIGYSIDQLLAWTSQSVYTLAEGPRYGTSLTLRVRQSGLEQTLTYTTPCLRPNKAPVVAKPLADQVLTVNVPASITLPVGMFTDADGTISSISLSGLPVGLSYNPTKQAIEGTPTLIGSSPAIVTATDNAGASVSDTFLITVRTVPRFAVTTILLDAQGKVLKELIDGDLLDSKKMPVLANLSCQPKVTAGSVLMELTGKAKRTVYANNAPYLLYPSGQGFKPDVGSYQLKITVFSGANGTGTLIGTTTIRFDVVVPNEGG